MAPKVPQAKTDEILARRSRVAMLRLAHLTQAEIAQQVGVSVGTVNADLKIIRDEWADRAATAFEDWISEELAKMDRLERALLPQALQGQGAAAEKVLSIMDRRAKLLGLNKPDKVEHTHITRDLIEAEIERLEAELARNENT